MGISINDLDGYVATSDPKGFGSRNRLREMVDGELKIAGGGMQKTSVFVNKNELFTVYGDGIDVYVRDVNDDIGVVADDITVYSDNKNLNIRKLRQVNRLVNDIEDLASQI